MKKIFITGGAGYVGAVLTPYLLSKGYKVTVLDLMIYGSNNIKKNLNLKLIKGDIRDTNLLKKIIPGNDVVVHLACISNDPSFELNPELGKSINLDAFTPLVEISKKSKVKRFIYASSSSVYGVKNHKNVQEAVKLEPLTDYSKYKAECEKILKKYKSKNFTPIILRPATVCGYSPRQRLDLVVNILTNLAYHKKEITVLGGGQLRPNIHIFDMVRAYDFFIQIPNYKVANKIFNVGFENQSVNQLALMVKKIIGKDIRIKKIKTNDNRSYHISSKKLNKIGFFTEKTIEDAIKDLKNVFDKKVFKNTLADPKYYNVKMMNKLQIK